MYTPLDNKLIGQSIAKLRNHRDIKAAEVARFLKLSPAAYTKYERGETVITVHFLNQIGQFFDINPMQFLQNSPETIIENIHDNGSVAIHYSNNNSPLTMVDEKLLSIFSTQITFQNEQIERLSALLEKMLNAK